MDASNTAVVGPTDCSGPPHSDILTVRLKTRKGANCDRIAGEPVLEVAVLRNCSLAAEVLAARRMSEDVG